MAKKFIFKLEPVLKYRRRIEDETRKRFLDIQRVRAEKEAEMERLRHETQLALDAMVDAKNGHVDVPKVRLLNRYLTGLGISSTQRQGEIKVIDKEVDKRRQELVFARQGVKAMERLKDRRHEDYVYQEQREETKALDEIGAMSIQRQKQELTRIGNLTGATSAR